MHEPGHLRELNDSGRASWCARIARCLAAACQIYGKSPNLTLEGNEHTTELTGVDWTGFPVRVAACSSSRHQALRLLDWTGASGDEGRRRLQEEYLEWRVVRDEAGALCRLEFTTELADYWRELAAHVPARVLQLVADFAGEASVAPAEVYGALDPFAEETTPRQREEAFAETMLGPNATSRYNSGQSAICCMVQPSNSLEALVAMMVAAARARLTKDRVSGAVRPMTADEAIPLMQGAAVTGRGSDPVLVERLGRLAYEGRLIAVDAPLGVYIQGVEHARLRMPNGTPVPGEWFVASRGLGAEQTGGRSLFQRLCFEVPAEVGCSISDLTDAATEQRIRFGGQIAEMVQLALFVRTSRPALVAIEEAPHRARPTEQAEGCAQVRETLDAYRAAGDDEIGPAPTPHGEP